MALLMGHATVCVTDINWKDVEIGSVRLSSEDIYRKSLAGVVDQLI